MSPFIEPRNDVEPIAVVGMSFRGPGDATNVENLLKMVSEGRESRAKIPKQKWNHEAFYHPDPNRFGSHNVEYGHWFQQDVTRFDAPFFNMTAAEAAALDPQQRMLLECTYEAMENSGTHMHNFVGTSTSVYVGSFCTDYADVLWRDPESVPMYQCTNAGHSRANTANRLSYSYDLKGPSVTVDTACSASLVALHLGCQSILNGDAKQAIVAGSSAILSHEGMVTMSMMRLLSHEGRCYTFDERANGYARGDGVGVLFLKPLQDALDAGDTIRAVIRGTGSNQDGKTPGITMPNGLSQEALTRHVYERSGLDPLETSYVECHGTGTQAGDTTETGALSRVFAPGRDESNPLVIGSVKSNIGHLEGASGVAGVIKTILMLENGIILPNRNFRKANPRIPLKEWKLRVPVEIEPWTGPAPRRASVNSFGYGGTNAHAIIESAADYLSSHGFEIEHTLRSSARAVKPIQDVVSRIKELSSEYTELDGFKTTHINGTNGTDGDMTSIEEDGKAGTGNSVDDINGYQDLRARLFVLSAFDQAAGKGWVEKLAQYLEDRKHLRDDEFLDSLAYTLNERRTIHPWKAAVTARSTEELLTRLKEGVNFVNTSRKQKLGFVFTGQGAQWCGMGKELIAAYPRFRKSLVACSAALARVGAPFELIEEFYKDPKESEINRALYSQPLCTALQIALVDLLASWGVQPTSVTGHSSGEIASAYAAGVLSAEDAMLVSYARGIASSELAARGEVDGSMVAVGMSKDDALPILAGLTSGRAGVACSNSPSSITVSGDLSAIDELQAILEEKKIFNRKLVVEVAYHSHHMQNVAEQYRNAISNIKLMPGNGVKFFSSVTGEQADVSVLGPDYWVSNMVGEVKFAQSLHRLASESGSDAAATSRKRNKVSPVHTLVELGPHSALAGPIKQILQANDKLSKASIDYQTALIRKKDAVESVLGLVAGLYISGYTLAFSNINQMTETTTTPLVDLPPYSWNHANSYSAESRLSRFYRDRAFPRVDLLGVLERNSSTLEPRWRNHIRLSEIPWAHDHKIQSNIVYPAAGYITMAVEAAYQRAVQRSVAKITGYQLREVVIGSALVIPEQPGEVEVAITLKSFSDSVRSPSDLWDEFVISSVSSDSRWTEHCRGLISVQTPPKSQNLVDGAAQEIADKQMYTDLIAKYESNCHKTPNVPQFYEELTTLGLEYGSTFANLRHLRSAPGACIGKIEIPDTAAVMPKNFEYPFVIHPATFDSFLHTIFVALSAQLGKLKDPAVPVSADEIFISHDITKQAGDTLLTYTSTEQKDYRFMSASIAVFDEKHERGRKPVVNISGLTCATLESDGGNESGDDVPSRAYNLQWSPDLELLSGEQITEICTAAPPPNAQFIREKLERVAFYFLEAAVAKSPSNFSLGEEYQQTLRTFLQSQIDLATRLHSEHGWATTNESDRASMIEEVRASSGVGRTLCYAGEQLPKVANGELTPAELIKGLNFEAFIEDPSLFQNSRSAVTYLDMLSHKTPNMSILTLGPQSGLASLGILSLLSDLEGSTPRFSSFHHTDAELNVTDVAKAKFQAWSDAIDFKDLDITEESDADVDDAEKYDVVMAFHVIGSGKSFQSVLSHSRNMLKPGGKLILVGRALKSLIATVLWGSLPSVLSSQENDSTISSVDMEALVQETGFSMVAATSSSTNKGNYGTMFLSANAENKAQFSVTKALIVAEENSAGVDIKHLQSLCSQSGVESEVVGLEDAHPSSEQACVVLSELSQSILADPSATQWDAIKRITLQSGGLVWVTRGGAADPNANMVSGLLRTIRSETGDKPIVTLNLDAAKPLPADSASECIVKVFQQSFGTDAAPDALDAEYAERAGILQTPRLVEDLELTKYVAASSHSAGPEIQPFEQAGRPLRMFVGTPGLLDTIHFTEDDRLDEELPDDWIEMQVKASGINFKDVMMAMGQIKVENLGWECSGILTAVGKHVKNFKVGDRVVCHGSGTFSTHSRGPAANAIKIPDTLSFETAAALPVTYVTAYHSVHNVARLQPGQTILVHAATGGLGQAIVELCKLIGAEIFVTVGTPEKKQFVIDRFGIPEDHIMFSRDNSFAKGIKRMTNGKGVDVVMNSLAGEGLRLSWDCIAPYGHFVELGARDITVNSRIEMSHFARNASFTAFNLAFMVQYNPEVANDVFARVMHLFAQGAVKGPAPVEVYPFSQMEQAFRKMQTGGHMGKLVAVSRPGDMVKVIPQDKSKNMFQPDASYVLVGGLGGIGRATAVWMAEHGAKNIIFINRSGLKSSDAQETVRVLNEAGCTTAVFPCDITKASQVEAFVAKATSMMPRIRGVIQGAMLLRDTMFEKMSLEDYKTVIAPKVQGTWNLHKYLPRSMDFFVMESSVSGIVGNTAQASYAAGNTFLDAFAAYRNSLGLPATTIDLGAISGVGYLANNDDLKQAMERQGFQFTDEKGLMRLIQFAILNPRREGNRSHAITGLGAFQEGSSLGALNTPMFSHFRALSSQNPSASDASTANNLRKSLKEAKALDAASDLICAALVEKIASRSGIPVENVNTARSMPDYGIDSLVAVELRNWIAKEMDSTVPILELLAGEPLTALAGKIAKRSRLVHVESSEES